MSRRMPRVVRLILALVLCSVLAAAHSWQAIDSRPHPPAERNGAMDWPMLGRTPARMPVQLQPVRLPTVWNIKTGKNIKWSVKLGSQSYGGPVIADGKIFVGTNNGQPRDPSIKGDKGILMCFREEDGTFLWQAVFDKLPTGRVHDWPEQGVASTPCVEGNRLYFMSNRCELICADVEGQVNGNQGMKDELHQGKFDADIIWRLDLMSELGVSPHNLAASAPLVMGDRVFVVTGNGHDETHENIPAPHAPSFLAVDKHTGKVLWHDNSPGKDILHGQWAAPSWVEVNGQGQVLMPGGDGWLRAFDPASGKLLWKFDGNPKSSKFHIGGKGTRSEIIAPAAVHEGKVYMVMGQDPEHGDGVGHLWCIDPRKARPGNVDLTPRNDNFDPAAAVNRDSGLVWHVGGTYPVINKGKPEEEFRFRRSLSMCALVDDMLFVTTYAGYLYCLDARTGRQHWVYDTYSCLWGSPTIADGNVYIGTEEGDVYVFEIGRACRRLAVNELEGSLDGAGAVVANGVLYIATKNTLYALEEQNLQKR